MTTPEDNSLAALEQAALERRRRSAEKRAQAQVQAQAGSVAVEELKRQTLQRVQLLAREAACLLVERNASFDGRVFDRSKQVIDHSANWWDKLRKRHITGGGIGGWHFAEYEHSKPGLTYGIDQAVRDWGQEPDPVKGSLFLASTGRLYTEYDSSKTPIEKSTDRYAIEIKATNPVVAAEESQNIIEQYQGLFLDLLLRHPQ